MRVARKRRQSSAREPGAKDQRFDPELYAALRAEVERDPVFRTLGPAPRSNRVVELKETEVLVETERSRENAGGAEAIPAWMFNAAWERLRKCGTLSNMELLKSLHVHRSSAVCAVLARVPGVERVPGAEIVLRFRRTGAAHAVGCPGCPSFRERR